MPRVVDVEVAARPRRVVSPSWRRSGYTRWQWLVLSALVIAGALLGTHPAHALNCTWQAGSAANWNASTANWSCSRIPTSADSVIFNSSGTNNNCTVNVDTTVVDFSINNSYTGTVAPSGAERVITVTGNFTQNAASSTFTAPNLVSITGNLSLQAGTFTSAENIRVTGAFSQSGGTFTGSSGALLVAGNFTVSAGAFTSPARLAVSGAFTYSGGTYTSTGSTTILSPRAAGTPAHAFGGVSLNNLIFSDAVSLSSGLIGYWKLDDTASPANDSAGANDLTWSGSPTYSIARLAPVQFSNAGSFKTVSAVSGSTGDYAGKTGITTFQNANWTLSVWFKDTAAFDTSGGSCGNGTGASELISAGNEYLMRLCNNTATTGILYVAAKKGTGTYDNFSSDATFTLNDGNWHHAAATRSGNVINIYLDGVKKTGTATGSQAVAGTSIRLAANTSNASYDFLGRLDDVRVYDRALSDLEILALWAGSSEAGGTVSHNPSGSVTVNGDLTVGDGTVGGTSAMAVKGSWYNPGGFYTGSGAISFTGTSTGKYIQSYGQRFASVTLNGSGGAWTLLDRMWIDGALTISAGTLDTGGYTIHAATLKKANGAGAVFTPNGGTLVLDSSSSQILTSDTALNVVRFEDPTETGLVNYYKLDEAVGSTMRDSSGNGNHGTFGAGGTWVNSGTAGAVATTAFDNYGAATFSTTSTADPTFPCTYASAMSFSFWAKAVASPATSNQRMVYTPWLNVALRTDNKVRADVPWSNATASWEASGTFTRNSWQHVVVTYDGSSYLNTPSFYFNGVKATTSLASGSTAPTSMATRTTTAGTCYLANAEFAAYGGYRDFEGSLDDVRIYNVALTQSEVDNLYGSGTGAYAGRGGTAIYTLQGNTTITSAVVDSGSTQTVYRAYDDAATAGTIQGYPVTSFNWSTYAFNGTYVLYNNVNGGTGDKLYKRDTNGVAQAEWSLPTSGNFVGAPKWTYNAGTYYVYVIDASGNAYKLLDNGSSFTATGPIRDGTNATATSPLAADSTNIYWLGNSGASTNTPMVFRLAQSTFSSVSSVGATASDGAVPTIITASGTSYLLFGNATKLYRTDVSGLGAPTASTFSTANGIYGRVTNQSGVVYFIDYAGTLYAANPTSLTAASWSYHDNVNHNGCSAGGACAAKNIYADFGTGNVFFGDADGHVYAVDTATHTVLNASYPLRPGSASDVFEAAPFYRGGVIAIGSTAGKVYFIDRKSNAGGAPALISASSLNLESGVSSIAWDNDGGQYMIGTNDGKLYYVSSISDPTPGFN